MDEERLANEFREKLFEITENEVGRHIIPLMVVDGDHLKSTGNGVFLLIEGKYFIVTAAHVLNKHVRMYAHVQNGTIPISGECRYTTDREIDLGFIDVIKQIGEFMSFQYEPVPLSKILIGHDPVISNQYSMIGFPGKKLRKTKNYRNFKPIAYRLQSSKDNVYNYYRRPKSDFYLLRMHGDARDENGLKLRRPLSAGMSGCGLWFFEYRLIGDRMQLRYSLVGLMTEEIKEGKFYVFSVTNMRL